MSSPRLFVASIANVRIAYQASDLVNVIKRSDKAESRLGFCLSDPSRSHVVDDCGSLSVEDRRRRQ